MSWLRASAARAKLLIVTPTVSPYISAVMITNAVKLQIITVSINSSKMETISSKVSI